MAIVSSDDHQGVIGLLSATTESGIIKHWFGYAAPDANLGVRTDKLVVVDKDPRHGGDESFAALEREHGEPPATWRVLTGGGREHVLFAAAADDVVISSVGEAGALRRREILSCGLAPRP